MKPLTPRSLFTFGGLACLLVACAILVGVVWDVFIGAASGFKMVSAPGFQELDLEKTGVYVGLYQHQGSAPIPTEALSRLDVRLSNKETGENIPVLLSGAGQVFSRFGTQAVLLFNFMIDKPGPHFFSAFYANLTNGPSISLLLIPQSTQMMGATLLVGALFFLIFLGLGIFLLVKARQHSKVGPR